MSHTIDELYLDIAGRIADTINDGWAKAVIYFQYHDGAGEFECVYIEDLDSGVEHDFDISYETYKAFNNLHEITTEGGENKWNRARFILYPTGKFSIDFEWDQSLADEMEVNSK